ncbi:MAG: hypothetical protein ACN4GM_13980 [Gammaproteobacteria bacterium]
MEYVIVECNKERGVLVDEQDNGQTNETLRVSAGKHTFSLAGEKNYRPENITEIISGTSVIEPHVISFEV